MNYEAIFCDETEDYRIPSEPTAGSMVTLRLRTGKDDAKSVRLMTHHWNHEMKKVASEGYFDYYETTMAVGEEPISYGFTISDDWDTVDRMYMKKRVKDDLAKYLYNKTKRKPMILPVIMNL